ncbi:hypothetical protein BaRGS_00021349 [Batillaria attramentaria]|uniref:Uncharacterized protein n=1 Tax=Batillaria attramentaria TaxID=370345 RepID=A0ABD0KK32_9CAEN
MLSFRRLHLPTTLALAAAPEQLCGKTISTNSSGTAGLLPGLQKGPCNITIIRDASASGNYTSLLVSNFVMNANDYVIFYDGEGQQQNAVVTVTGSREPFLVVINSTETFITVMLTANNTNSSMTMDYDVTKCQQTLQADQAALVRSPEFLPDRMVFECLYSLNGTVSGLMALSFQTFSLTNATLNITAGGQQSLGVYFPVFYFSLMYMYSACTAVPPHILQSSSFTVVEEAGNGSSPQSWY